MTEVTMALGNGDILEVLPTGGDVRMSFMVGKPGSGCPSSHHWSLTAAESLALAEALVRSVRKNAE